MARSIPWRRNCPDQVYRRIQQALEARFYILRETGPTGFLVKEDEQEKKFKVFLGDPNSCTCSTFMKEKDLCIHILWILLRKFRIGKENPLVFQKALVEREINEVIQGLHVQKRDTVKTDNISLDEKDKLAAKSIDEEDVCPICQEELLDSKEPLTHCKFGCGNNIHIKCMKVWAQHRKSDGDNMIKCPLCRTDFGSYQDIIQEFHKVSSRYRRKLETNDVHIGATCNNCKTSPIQGKCFRCVVCIDIHLCQECFGKQIHTQHSFQFRKNTNQRWRVAARNPNRILPAGIAENLQNREIGEEDYELLLQLDSRTTATNSAPLTLPLATLNATSHEIKERMDCPLCCEVFRISNHVRRLACLHSFHKDCIDAWISRGNLLCPFDRSRISGRKDAIVRSKKSVEKMVSDSQQVVELSILGINSSNFPTKKQEQEVKPKRASQRCSTNSPDTSANGITVDVNELFIHGGVVRRGCDSEERTQPLSDPSTRGTHVEYVIRSQHHRNPKARLPPLHPNRSKLRCHSNDRLKIDGCVAEGSSELKIGDFEVSSERIQRRKGSLTKKRTSSRTLTSISSSEPDLVSLSDAFRVSRITNLEGNGL